MKVCRAMQQTSAMSMCFLLLLLGLNSCAGFQVLSLPSISGQVRRSSVANNAGNAGIRMLTKSNTPECAFSGFHRHFGELRRYSAKKISQRLDLSLSLARVPETKAYSQLRDMLGGMPVFGGYSSFSEVFAKFDKDMSGKISLEELQSTLKEMGLPLSTQQVKCNSAYDQHPRCPPLPSKKSNHTRFAALRRPK